MAKLRAEFGSSKVATGAGAAGAGAAGAGAAGAGAAGYAGKSVNRKDSGEGWSCRRCRACCCRARTWCCIAWTALALVRVHSYREDVGWPSWMRYTAAHAVGHAGGLPASPRSPLSSLSPLLPHSRSEPTLRTRLHPHPPPIPRADNGVHLLHPLSLAMASTCSPYTHALCTRATRASVIPPTPVTPDSS